MPASAALKALEVAGQEPSFFLDRHIQGDWGDVGVGDWRVNDDALVDQHLLDVGAGRVEPEDVAAAAQPHVERLDLFVPHALLHAVLRDRWPLDVPCRGERLAQLDLGGNAVDA